jgi:DNA-directed RNA polymerase alpha subunit
MGGGQRGVRWTAKEDSLLRELVASKASETILAAKLKRSPEAIRVRLWKLQKEETERTRKIVPCPELPDNISIEQIDLPSRIERVLLMEGLRTVGEVREASDDTLLSFQDFGPGSLSYIRNRFGLPSQQGVRPAEGRTENRP